MTFMDTKNILERPEPPTAVRWSDVVGRLACRIGMHRWRFDSDYFMGIAQCTEVCLFWRTCERCGVSQLKHITR